MPPDPVPRPSPLDGFLKAIREDPAEDAHVLVLADWLEEQGDPRAELVRVHRALRRVADETERQSLEERLRGLLAAGVRACVPEIVNSVGMRLAWIPAGTFLMGSPETEEGRDVDEGPQHRVRHSDTRTGFRVVCTIAGRRRKRGRRA
jgi:uncharacterized protein (TIGR02996 family)